MYAVHKPKNSAARAVTGHDWYFNLQMQAKYVLRRRKKLWEFEGNNEKIGQGVEENPPEGRKFVQG